MSEWISVKDSLPNDKWADPLCDFSKMQIVCNSAGVSMAFYSRVDEQWFVDCPADRDNWIDKITHWMPMPKPYDYKAPQQSDKD